ncbi:ATP-grasp domain-containing protein [Kitasatospora mediocidica]|uniref:ATP-grasp domain-containing protein n=1 Tax=Kitasatospora mediocidica TaxID=58352 RepID=UPI000563AA10|nr:ATP-grasp domain-containing protein [Kitasatospora mediocidica]
MSEPTTAGPRPAVLIVTDLVILSRHYRLIDEARRRGLVPLAVFGPETPADRLAAHRADPDHPLAALAEVVHVADCSLDTLLPAIQPLLARYEVRAVVNCGEVFVEAAGTIAECLGLPGPGAHAARVCRNKLLQRVAAPALSPRWTVLHPAGRAAAADWRVFPAVLKPVARMSSSGVQRIDGPAQLVDAVRTYPADEVLLVEQLVSGPEYSVESLVHQGQLVWSGVTAKRTTEEAGRFFAETGHRSPAPGLAEADRRILLQANAELLEAVHFDSGMTHAEFRLHEGRAVLMEVAGRPPGGAIAKLWQLTGEIEVEPALLDLMLGCRPAAGPARRQAAQLYLDHPHGVLRGVGSGPDVPVAWVTEDGRWPEFDAAAADHPARCHAVVVTKSRGDLLGDQVSNGDRAVSVIVDCPLDGDLDAVADRFAAAVRIDADPPSAVPGTLRDRAEATV